MATLARPLSLCPWSAADCGRKMPEPALCGAGADEEDARALLLMCGAISDSPTPSPGVRMSPPCSPRSTRTFGFTPSYLPAELTEADRALARSKLEADIRSSFAGGDPSPSMARWQQQIAQMESSAWSAAKGSRVDYEARLREASFIFCVEQCSPSLEGHESPAPCNADTGAKDTAGTPLQQKTPAAVQRGKPQLKPGARGAAHAATPLPTAKRRKVAGGPGGSTVKTSVPWTDADDAQLKSLVEQIGTKWTLIGSKLGRTGKQCRERWCNHVDPAVSHEPWTEEEDMLLRQLHRELGNKWVDIAQRLPGRPYNAVKNRFNKASLRFKFKPETLRESVSPPVASVSPPTRRAEP